MGDTANDLRRMARDLTDDPTWAGAAITLMRDAADVLDALREEVRAPTLEALRAEVADLTQRLATSEASRASAVVTCAELREAVATAELRLLASEVERDAARAEIKEAQRRLEDGAARYSEMRARRNDAERERDALAERLREVLTFSSWFIPGSMSAGEERWLSETRALLATLSPLPGTGGPSTYVARVGSVSMVGTVPATGRCWCGGSAVICEYVGHEESPPPARSEGDTDPCPACDQPATWRMREGALWLVCESCVPGPPSPAAPDLTCDNGDRNGRCGEPLPCPHPEHREPAAPTPAGERCEGNYCDGSGETRSGGFCGYCEAGKRAARRFERCAKHTGADCRLDVDHEGPHVPATPAPPDGGGVKEVRITEIGCDHCGDVAITREQGWFGDGDGGRCESCGFPGWVSCDGEELPYWRESDEVDAKCDRPGCSECRPAPTPGGGDGR